MAGKNLMLYHGSSVAVGNPVWGLGNPKNDYGLGFTVRRTKSWHANGRVLRLPADM